MVDPTQSVGTVSLWDSLPRAWRSADADPDGVMAALIDVLSTELQTEYEEFLAARDLWRPLWTDARFLPYLAQARGWALESGLITATGETATPAQVLSFQRKLIPLLVPIYRAKGTIPGIVAALRLFLGMEVTVRSLWADGWRLGVSRLGGRRVAVTAAAGQTFVPLGPDSATPLRYTPGLGMGPCSSLSVWVNGVRLRRGEFVDTAEGVTLKTKALTYYASGSEPDGARTVALPFNYTVGAGVLSVWLNGAPLIDNSWSEPTNTTITLSDPLTRGDEVVVRRSENPVVLAGGDAVVICSTEDDASRLAPSWEDAPERALRLVVTFPRALLTGELVAATKIIDVMKPSKANVMLVQPPGTSGAVVRWRLGAGLLGRSTRAGMG